MNRRILTIVLVSVLAVALALAFVVVGSDPGGRDASPGSNDIEARADDADTACRGGHGDEASTWQACDVRQALMVDLQQRGRCLDDEDHWGKCLTAYDEGEDIEVCPPTAAREQLLVAGLSCAEASEFAADVGQISTEPARVDRFTCVASSSASPRTVWCGDYGVDLAAEESTASAIVWRIRA